MDYIAEILLQDKNNIQTLNSIILDYVHQKMRYDDETSFLRFIILQQLNLRKNQKKGRFEKNSWDQLFVLLLEEIYELKVELDNPDEINYERVLSEIGDIGAFLIGFVAKAIEESKIQNEIK